MLFFTICTFEVKPQNFGQVGRFLKNILEYVWMFVSAIEFSSSFIFGGLMLIIHPLKGNVLCPDPVPE